MSLLCTITLSHLLHSQHLLRSMRIKQIKRIGDLQFSRRGKLCDSSLAREPFFFSHNIISHLMCASKQTRNCDCRYLTVAVRPKSKNSMLKQKTGFELEKSGSMIFAKSLHCTVLYLLWVMHCRQSLNVSAVVFRAWYNFHAVSARQDGIEATSKLHPLFFDLYRDRFQVVESNYQFSCRYPVPHKKLSESRHNYTQLGSFTKGTVHMLNRETSTGDPREFVLDERDVMYRWGQALKRY